MDLHYGDELVSLYKGDSAELLTELPTESVDLVVTDPPYGVEWQSGHRAESFGPLMGDGKHQRDEVRAVLTECVRLVAQSRHLYVFGPLDVMEGLKVSAPAALVWDKVSLGSGDLSQPWAPAHEPLTFVVTQHRHAGKTGRENLPVRLRKGSVLRYSRPTGRKVRHPSEKPVALLAELIESSSRQGDVVLDPYAGSGSTGVAAVLLGRQAILVERDERWCDLAAERLRAAREVRQAAVQL